MNLNIVTAGANCIGKALLQKVAKPADLSLGLSRKGCELANVLDVRISDLACKEETQKALLNILQNIDASKIEAIRLFHNCCYAVAEIPERDLKHLLANNPKLFLQDLDGDGLDDRSYHALLTTFRNVFQTIFSLFPEKQISIGTICSLTDKKSYIPTVFQSMVKCNHLLRAEIESLARKNANIQSVCVSASTVKTETEQNFRKYCTEQEYWVSGETIADILVSETESHHNVYKDIDVYVPHPKYSELYKNETDEELTQRIKREVGLIK